jgi:hypothetical protein
MEYSVEEDNGRWVVYRESLASQTLVARYLTQAAADSVAFLLNASRSWER